MGDWSTKPWGCDEAADWFHRFWTKGGIAVLIREFEEFDERQEKYDSIRAASYLLQTLGITFVWPVDHSDELEPLLRKAILILKNMIDPPTDDWGYLEMCGNDPGAILAVKEQITALQDRLSDLTPH
ncbi:hypothetical protein [Ottowia thiooxydans]|uniref:hypothetical protein n=1 Tax=Ottowia thiooxydans TaxID=219182 RepID=UPI000425EFD3|nr:hypothetical protein [Ottowia thiooxydans]